MLIDRTDTDVGLPSLTLEGYTPSPLQHMKLQSELIVQLFNRFGLPKNVVRPNEVQDYQAIVDRWMSTFPSTYNVENPDKTSDVSRPWIVLHRHYLQTMAFSMMLDPIRAYLAKPMTRRSPPDELKIRSDGVGYSLRLMDALHGFFDHVYPRDAKFHFVLFCIFDTAAVLCSALMHDRDSSIPRRNEIISVIDKAVAMLKRLNTVTKTARTSYEVLVKIAQNISRPTQEMRQPNESARKRHRVKEIALTPPSMSQAEIAVASDPGSVESHISYTTPPSDAQIYHIPASQSASPGNYGNGDGSVFYVPPVTMAPGTMMPPSNPAQFAGTPVDYSPPYVNMTPPTDEFYQAIDYGNFGAISERDLGDLASLWNYESLNLNFINPG